jgi:imidazolonepropionase-like amidohydrolase
MKSILIFLLALMSAAPLASQPKGSVHIKNATVITITGETLETTDVLVQNGLITRIGKNLATPRGVETVDATGKYLLPGIIDAHSHLALASLNEATSPVTAEVRMADAVNAYDIGMYRALAGGVTISHAMHGSANVIGGQGATLKHHYGESAENLLMRNAPRTIKFALGENPTRVHGQGNGVHPRTRMGVEQIIRETFDAAKDYKRRRAATPTKVAKDERLEVISDIIDGKILVHCHSYRADEILMLMRVFNDYGIKNYTMQHANEAFKVAPELAKNGVHTSVFADWWAYKFEVYYSTSYNAAILNKYGVINSINSDSDELIRHLNHEAAKVVRYGGASELDALKMITINPAIQLGIDKRVGSIEVGKEADFALWSAHPLSIYSIAERTWVDGVKRFDIDTDKSDMRLRVNPADKYASSSISESGRHADACMQDVLDFFTLETMEHSHE